MKKKIFGAITLMFLLIIVVISVFADPVSPDQMTTVGSERRSVSSTGESIEAQAGNVTALNINHTRVTEAWQGYYGNVSGTVVLDDANNNSMYDWAIAIPSGEVFATRNSGSVTWSNIACAIYDNTSAELPNACLLSLSFLFQNQFFPKIPIPFF